MRAIRLAFVGVLLIAGLMVGACSSPGDGTRAGDGIYVTEGGTERIFAQYEPGAQVFPMPNDIVWSASGGHVYLPPDDADSPEMAFLKTSINGLSLPGLSPNMFLTVPTTGAVNPESLNLIVFRLDGAKELPRLQNPGFQDFVADTSNPNVLKLVPKEPFSPGAKYGVAVARGLLDAEGYELFPSTGMQAILSPVSLTETPWVNFEPLRQMYIPFIAGIENATTMVFGPGNGWTRDDLLVIWTFTTASFTVTTDGGGILPYGDILGAGGAADMKALADAFPSDPGAIVWLDAAGDPVPGPMLIPAGLLSPNLVSVKFVTFGAFPSLKLPDATHPAPSTDMVPFLIALPDAAAFMPPWNVVAFQHAITGDKTHGLVIAEALANGGFATVAIDAPFHGDRALAGMPSGTGFLTTNLLMSRRNFYQSAIDLWELGDLISAGIDLGIGDAAPDLTTGDFGFASHSLGSIIGSVYLSEEDRVNRGLLCSPVSVLTNVLDGSTSPNVAPLVDALGLTRGTIDYYVFMNVAQWLMDPVDSAYTKSGDVIGPDLTVMMAYADPTLPTSSTLAFTSNVGYTSVTTVDPADIDFPTIDDVFGGAFEYGYEGHPITHDFLISSDISGDPRYADYDQAEQDAAHMQALYQTLGFFSAPLAP